MADADEVDSRAHSPFGIRHRFGRVLWGAVYLVLFRASPRPFHGWRRFLLRLFGAKIGKSVHIYPRAKVWAPWNIEIGEVVGVADGVELYSQARIVLEDQVTISQEAFLCTGSHDYRRADLRLWTAPIIVRRNAWIAARSFIHPGVTIGRNVVVGACSVVTKDVGDGLIVAGNPARIIGKRDDRIDVD